MRSSLPAKKDKVDNVARVAPAVAVIVKLLDRRCSRAGVDLIGVLLVVAAELRVRRDAKDGCLDELKARALHVDWEVWLIKRHIWSKVVQYL